MDAVWAGRAGTDWRREVSLPKPYYEDEEHGIVIYHADCREILPHLPKVDLLLTDPPYGINSMWSANPTGGFMTKEEAAHIKKWDMFAPKEIVIEAIAKANEAIVWGGNYFGFDATERVFVWDKCLQGMHFAEIEIAWVISQAGTSRLCRLPLKSSEVFGVNSERRHPTQKPLALMKWCLGFFPKAETVLDPFMGSGTTLVACKQLGRRCIGIEIEERYCEIAARRLSQWMLFGQDELAQIGGGK